METASPTPEGPPLPSALPEAKRLEEFGARIDQIRRRVEAQIGKDDVEHIKKMRRFSTAMEVVGRGLIHLSFEPVGFSAGVIALWLHKQMEATEIGHTALHGAFDGLEGAEKFQSKDFYWDVPIDEESWKYGHNVRHHQYTNIAGRDPDIHYGPVRLNERTPWRPVHRFQIAGTILTWLNFGAGMNLHFTGLADLLQGNGRPERFDFVKDNSPASWIEATRKAFRKYVPYYAKEYVFYPLLAGPFFWKVFAGNFLASTLRDVYSAATIWCGHVGADVKDYAEGTKAKGRGQWYAMQAAAANNFEVPLPVSILCGALDRQIEHHLFPQFPTNRLREIAPEVKALCDEYGVEYKTGTWPEVLRGAFRRLSDLSRPGAEPRNSIRSAPASWDKGSRPA